MVLSNKKLKEKLRGALAEAALSKSRQNEDANSSLAYLEELQRSSRKGPSKREKRRHRKELLHEEEIPGAQTSKDQASQDNDSNGKKKKKGKNKGTSIEDNGSVMEDRDTHKKNKEKQMRNKNSHLENKNTHLESGGSDKSKSNKKKKRKRGEDKDAQLERNGESDENRGNQRISDGGHSENGQVEESKSSKKKKKQKHKQEIQSERPTDDKITSVVEEPPDDIIINAQETTVTESQESEYDALKVYVGGIPYYSNEDDIRSFFEGCGTITEVDCMTFPDSGKFRGIALISFKTEAAAKRAVALDGSDMGGLFLKIEQYKTVKRYKNDKRTGFEPTKVDNSNRAYIGNLSWDITEDDLKYLFKDCEISAIRFGMDKTTGEFKGYGHVDFADDVSLAMALKLDQEVVCGRPIRISYALPKRDSKPDDNAKSTSEKKKRRTCHSCGEPGHLSFSCPQKQSTEIVDANGDS